MRKEVIAIAVLVIISIVLASLLSFQLEKNRGNLATTQLNTKPGEVIQNIRPLPVASIATNSTNISSSSVKNNANASTILDAESTVFNEVFNKVKNSVVQITSTVNTVMPNIIINGNPLQSQSTSLGSGFIYDAAKGYIITNNHVIQGANK